MQHLYHTGSFQTPPSYVLIVKMDIVADTQVAG